MVSIGRAYLCNLIIPKWGEIPFWRFIFLFLKTVRKGMFLYKWPLYNLFWPFFCHMYVKLTQKWGSDGHFEVLNRSYLRLVQKLWHKMQIFLFLFLLYQLRFRLIKHLKMTVWISVLWKITMWLPNLVIKWQFSSCYFLGVHRTCSRPQVTSEAIRFEPIKV